MSLIQPMILLALLAQAKPPGPEVKTLHVSPAALPSPLLKYRLLPLESELQPGDAAPMYLRINGEMSPQEPTFRLKPAEWIALPADKLPRDEVRALVGSLLSRIQQIEFASNRQTCTWNYSLPEQRTRSINIHLPDVQTLRNWLRVVALKGRMEVIDGKPEEAIRTIRTGLAASRHVAEGPFLVNGLVGIATAREQLNVLDELLDRPGVPNLYWALTSLPRPMIDLRLAYANEARMTFWLFPDLDGLDVRRTEGEWAGKLARFHAQLLEWSKEDLNFRGDNPNPPKIPPELATLNAFRAWAAPLARAFVAGKSKENDMPGDDQAILLYVADQYYQFYDHMLTATYVPHAETSAIVAETRRRGEALAKTPLRFFAHPLERDIVNVERGLQAGVALDRKIAALRTVEAIRLHASKTGKLPGNLDEIKDIPVPTNPATGKPFEYRVEGDTAVLHAPMPEGPLSFPLTYRIQLR